MRHLDNDYTSYLAGKFPRICYDIYCGACFPDTWEAIIVTTLQEINDLQVDIQISQIKSKIGRLRIYFDSPLTEIELEPVRALIRKAEALTAP